MRANSPIGRVAAHVLLPSLGPVAIVALYLTPVGVIGCVNRGLLALGVVFASLIAGIAVGLVGIRARREDPRSRWWWIASMLILLAPALLVLGPLG